MPWKISVKGGAWAIAAGDAPLGAARLPTTSASPTAALTDTRRTGLPDVCATWSCGFCGCSPACAGRASERQSPALTPGQRRRRRRLDFSYGSIRQWLGAESEREVGEARDDAGGSGLGQVLAVAWRAGISDDLGADAVGRVDACR